ncbi:MobC family plasmid mobilization relaxosome protein [Actinomadura terrae]|uniref:MobC family plasmid mobilization relaxosome protein n=1 Tax=Actinomadura terrae TaxID=604353 RepID=UPI001FA730DD|nr:MobC family plasmid mobilization relaxosome protein [Actinomadura terrae]
MDDGEGTADVDADVPAPRPAESVTGPSAERNERQGEAGQPARRRRAQGGRGNKYSVRFTDEEQRLVQAAADAAGLTVPHLIAETVLASLTGRGTRQMPVADRRALASELAAVRGFLAAIGGNVNQLAAAASSGNVPAAGAVEATMAAVARAVARLDVAIAPLDPRPTRHTARCGEDERRVTG